MQRDQIVGCLVGGAIGDAMGGPHENQPAPINPYSGGAWCLSDDTQLSLATCEAIRNRGAVDPEAIAATFLEWFRARRLSGIGASTYQALNSLAAGSHWALAGRKGEKSAGNGAAMRIAPLAFFCDPTSAEDRVLIRDVCRITHHNDEAYVGALAVLLAMREILADGDSSRELLTRRVVRDLPDTRVRDQLLAVSELDPATEIPEVAERFGSTGWVVHTVPLALFAAQQLR
ncbi:MAG: ADP-ribosylglycohydrolase family protein, partial [Acidobacteriota bacterium]